MKQKGFILFPIILIISLLVIVGYIIYQNHLPLQKTAVEISPTPVTNINSLTDWNTYKAGKLGFELRHPETIKFEFVNPTETDIHGYRYDPYTEISIEVSDKSPEEIVKDNGLGEYPKLKQTIADISTEIYTGWSGEAGAYPFRAFILSNLGKSYYFNISTFEKWEEVDQILSTFKFTQ